jgi:Ca2+/Na+ antiporter
MQCSFSTRLSPSHSKQHALSIRRTLYIELFSLITILLPSMPLLQIKYSSLHLSLSLSLILCFFLVLIFPMEAKHVTPLWPWLVISI